MLCISGARTLVSLWYQGFGEVGFLRVCTRHVSLKWNSPAVSETKPETETKPTQRSQITDQNLRFKRAKRAKRAKRVSNS